MSRTVFLTITITFIFLFALEDNYAQDSVKYVGIGSYYVFYKNQTFKYYSIPCDICTNFADENNLISYGHYRQDNERAYYLYSDEILNPNNLKLLVDEKMSAEKNGIFF